MPGDKWRSRQDSDLELSRHPINMTDPAGAAPRPSVMPVFMGAPWAPRFGGPGSELQLQEWVSQTKYLAGLQGLSDQQQVQFVLGSLEGEAKREVLATPEASRNTAGKIFELLKELYGDRTSVAALRAQFFNCKQGPKQPLRSFSLQVRELFNRLKRREDSGLPADDDKLLRDQFILGLRDGQLKQTLKLQLRGNAALKFEDIQKEALALEMDQVEPDAHATDCFAASATPRDSTPMADWKKELREEIMKDVKEQMSHLSKTLLDELRGPPSRGLQPPRERSYSDGSWRGRQSAPRPPNSRFQWDEQGQPICSRCGKAGHMSRNCPSRRASQEGF